jgi:hypothetical protein
MIKAFIIAIGLLAATSQIAQAQKLVWKTEAELGEVEELPHCDLETDADCHDVIPYMQTNRYGVNYYLTMKVFALGSVSVQ